MKRAFLKFLVLTVMLLGLFTSQAQANHPIPPSSNYIFTYQGRITKNGAPVNESCNFRFSLWTSPVGGSQLGNSILKESVGVVNGLFTATLDFGQDVFRGKIRWLQIKVQCPAETGPYVTLGRQPLTAAPFALSLPGLWTESNGSVPNIIGGSDDNLVEPNVQGAVISGGGPDNKVWDHNGTVGGGEGNEAGSDDGDLSSSIYATVAGGYANLATGEGSAIGGGYSNQAAGLHAFVGGGFGNHAENTDTAICGGFGNTVDEDFSAIGGGYLNEIHAKFAFIGGGGPASMTNPTQTNNKVLDDFGVIGGGGDNMAGSQDGDSATATYATVAGGRSNHARATYATVGGGNDNTAYSEGATVGGGWMNGANGRLSTVGGGSANAAGAEFSTVAGGTGNLAQGPGAFIAGGGWDGSTTGGNRTHAAASTIGGGLSNEIDSGASYATIAGGYRNKAQGSRSVIAGGEQNHADGYLATVGGGFNNRAGERAVVAGGVNNQATGTWSAIPGGSGNLASGNYSFAAGRRAKAIKNGCFIWADSTNLDLKCSQENRTYFRSTGGFVIYTYFGSDGSRRGVYLAPSGSSWNQVSDRNAKENFRPVDKEALLERLARIEINTWNYKEQDPAIRHIGPTAQDFNALLPDLGGEGETYINTMDADGVALAAIQALYERSQKQAARIAQLEAENAALQAQLADLAERLARLEAAQEP